MIMSNDNTDYIIIFTFNSNQYQPITVNKEEEN